jgi:hypothetical protein
VNESGIIPVAATTVDFLRIIDKVYMISPEQANNCVSPNTAKFLYARAKAMIGTATRLEATVLGIDLDGLLPGVFSNKAILELVIKDGIPYVFKFAIDVQFQKSIDMDFEASALMKGIEGLVRYTRFEVERPSRAGKYVGSLSMFYALSLNKLRPPLSEVLLVSIIDRVSRTIALVHNQDLSINDIKPDNMYMDGQGNVDIGDFGGVTKIGEGFRETTQNYIPQDMYESNVAIPAVDYMCLINSIIEMSGGRIGGNVKQLREAVDRVNNQNVRNRLLTMLE